MRKQVSTLLLATCCLTISAAAQDKLPIKSGKVPASDFDVKSRLIDSNTNAVVIADVGKAEFIANTSDLSFSIIFKQKKTHQTD